VVVVLAVAVVVAAAAMQVIKLIQFDTIYCYTIKSTLVVINNQNV
jgi:hypothetical protein